jgi:uncharacterized protein YkwD
MRKILILLSMTVCILQAGFFSSPEKVTVVRKMPPMDVDYEKGEALFILNEIRETMGMNTLMPNSQLQMAAQAHADYLVRNHTASHNEIQGLPGFTGETPTERAFRAGYLSSQVLENLSTQTRDAKHSVHGLLSAIYHRFAFLDVGIDEVGVGLSQDAKEPENNAFVYVMGNSYLNALCHEKSFKGYGRYLYHVCRDESFRIAQNRFEEAKDANKMNNPKVVVYPYDGQQEVPPAFYSEIPDPLPDYEVSGFPVSVTFNDYFFDKVELLEFKLYKDGDKPVTSVRLLNHDTDPNDRFSQFEFALFPLERLAYDTDYRAQIVYREKGRKRYLSWQFHTVIPNEKMLKITEKETTITIRKDQSYLIYIVPLNEHDVIEGVTFPDDVYVRFVDNNTLRMKLMSDRSKSFDIKSRYHTIHVNIE